MKLKLRIIAIIALASGLLYGCGEPYREEGHRYGSAAIKAIENYQPRSKTSQPLEKPYWNDCGKEFTCLFLYNTKDQKLVEAIVSALLAAQAEIKKPGIKLTVYTSLHGEPKLVFREITIK
ncbi:MAG: hypothetical protein H3C29_16475 [Simplicispira suum]|uniref:hypothetical protein n=1 Tax=Simplicispira suum TaxID=2109915 RepID=UPI001C6CC6CE|nr:hypothetical protein [Simplicispira suum]MBW7834797.1 hypothetical protein [Simplicispira suum]